MPFHPHFSRRDPTMKRNRTLRRFAPLAGWLAIATPCAVQAQTQVAPPSEAAVNAATDAYARLNAGDLQQAIAAAGRAVAAAPDNLDYRLLLADALLRADQDREAYDALVPVQASPDYRVQSRLAEAADGAGLKVEAAQAYGASARSAPDASSRAYLTRSRIALLLQLEDRETARAEFDAAWTSGVLRGSDALDTGMLAIAVGDDVAAQDAFADAERTSPLTGNAALNAGYSARRIGWDAEAVRYFGQGLDSAAAGEIQLTPQQTFEIRREVETLQRRWGFVATISQGVDTTVGAGTPGDADITQAGAEAYWRVGGYRSGRPVDVFVRAYGTLASDQGGATGGETVQGWIGVRWKPLAATNLILEASKMVALGDLARDDVMVRAAWSMEEGTDLRFDRSSWPMWRIYADAARIVDDGRTLGVIDGRAGWTWRFGDRDLLTPFVGVRGGYDSLLADTTTFSAGPGVAWRHWFRETRHGAPASYIEAVLGYGFSLSDDDRSEGAFITFSLNY